jgi:acyl-[acyl-carrier-protein] desaturase
MKPDRTIINEIEEQRPSTPAGLLTRLEKDRLIERGLTGLYRWYLSRSQATRNWNPDKDFNWRAFRTDHSAKLNAIIEGFFAVEQYVPDYVTALLYRIRESYGRSHFHIRWGSEEEKHSDTWLNALLFSRFRTPQWIEDYKQALRNREWKLPWDDAFHMVFYPVIQERATQLSYLNLGAIARGETVHPEYKDDADPVLVQVTRTIAIDEAAHYNFFIECARLIMYYYPTQSLEALADVIKHFAMPAGNLIPNYQQFFEIVAKAGIYGPREHARDVLQAALNNLNISGRKALEAGVKRFRLVPDVDGNPRDTAFFETLDYEAVQTGVKRLFGRIEKYEQETGLAEIDPTRFVASRIIPEPGF